MSSKAALKAGWPEMSDAEKKSQGWLTTAEILVINPGMNPAVLELDPIVGISDDSPVHVKFLFEQGCTEAHVGEMYPEYTDFAEVLNRVMTK